MKNKSIITIDQRYPKFQLQLDKLDMKKEKRQEFKIKKLKKKKNLVALEKVDLFISCN